MDYYFTETFIEVPELYGKSMGHVESTSWLQSKPLSASAGPLSFEKIYKQNIRDGHMVNQILLEDGVMSLRCLWKMPAWENYVQQINEIQDIDLLKSNYGWSIGLDPRCTSSSFKKVQEEEKMELIKQYFMDYFVD